MGGRTTGWGAAEGERVVTNDDLSETLDTSDEWIAERTGIRARRIGGTTSGLALTAGRAALDQWGGDPADVGLVLLATSTPDRVMPASASAVQAGLGLQAGAFDLNAACAGFVYGLVSAFGHVHMGGAPVLLIGADVMSGILDWDDRSTAVLFGDGAGATVVEPCDGPGELAGWDLTSDGTLAHVLKVERGATLEMDGKEVFRRAVRMVVDSVAAALDRAGLSPSDVDLFVPHQANERIIAAVCSRLGIPDDAVVNILDRTGNTSAASIPQAVVSAVDAGRVSSGDVVVLCGFGAGMATATAVLHWDR